MYKARAFFFVCAGIFLLALAYHLGARSAGAQAGSGIRFVGGDHVVVNGEMWTVNTLGSGQWVRAIGLPVPVDEVLCALDDNTIGPCSIVTTSGVSWFNNGSGWTNLDPPPGVVPAQSISVGQLKAKYAK